MNDAGRDRFTYAVASCVLLFANFRFSLQISECVCR